MSMALGLAVLLMLSVILCGKGGGRDPPSPPLGIPMQPPHPLPHYLSGPFPSPFFYLEGNQCGTLFQTFTLILLAWCSLYFPAQHPRDVTIDHNLLLLRESLVHSTPGMLCLPTLHHQFWLGATVTYTYSVQLLTTSSWTILTPQDLISCDQSLPPHA